MENTNVSVGFVDSTTLQLRLELGTITPASVTTDIPDNIHHVNDSDGYAFDIDGTLLGRLRGTDNQYFVPLDIYDPSDIEAMFDWVEENGQPRVAPADIASDWTVSVDGQEVTVLSVSRKANILETANTGWDLTYSTLQNVFFELAEPLEEGARISISFNDPAFDAVAADYDPDAVISEAIHVNLAGYDPDDAIKTAYLSSWNGFEYDADGERGGVGVPQSFENGLSFTVFDESNGQSVLTGTTELVQGIDDGTNFWQNYALTDVYQMDISDLGDEGTYYIVVDGVGRSQSFEIDDDHWGELFDLTFKGYYHQRSGIALEEPYTDWTRPTALHPDDGIVVYETTVKITETSEAWDGSLPKPFEFWEGNLTGQTLDDAWGGWHDAGDFDRRTQHMQSSRKLIELHEMQTDWSEGYDGNIPESGNGIPDILDEAIWGTEVFRRLQHDDGGVPGGIESATYGSFGDSSFTDQRALYAYAPDAWTSWEYAATAAKIYRALKPYDAAEAQAWLDSGIAAFNWAEANMPSDYDNGWYPTSRNLAAAELFEATGEGQYKALFAQTFVYADNGPVEWFENQYEAAYVYASSDRANADPDLQQLAYNVVKDRADNLLAEGSNSGFGFIHDPYAPYGWGATATQPTYSADFILRMHALTGDDAYLDPVVQDVDYAFGANPLNMAFVTGMDQIVDGIRKPEEILQADTDVLGRDPAPGITLYGEHNVLDYGWNWYHSEMWEDTWPNYYDAPVHESWNGAYGFVPVTEYTVMQGMEDMAFVTGYLAAEAGDPGNDVDETWLQVGKTVISQATGDQWFQIDFDQTIEDAVVILGAPSGAGGQPIVARTRNVTDTGFEVQIDEWEYLDGGHVPVRLGWMAGSEGTHTLDNGSTIVFGAATGKSGSVTLSEFDDTPLVIGQTGGSLDTAQTHRLDDVTSTGFDWRMQAEEARLSETDAEDFAWVAIDPGHNAFDMGVTGVSHNWTAVDDGYRHAIFADMQTMNGGNPATMRHREKDGFVELRVQEERSLDGEVAHNAEDVAWLAMDEGVFALS